MEYKFFTGIGTRELNEDVILIEDISQSATLFLVVDGMGGYQKGEIAAKIISENIATHLRSISKFDNQGIENACKKANLAIKQFNTENAITSGATVGGILLSEKRAISFWIGDVKIYHFKDGKLAWQSKSHTLLNEMLETDAIRSPEMHKRYSHIVTRSIAGKRENSKPEFFEIENLTGNSSFIICSDGVHNTMTAEHLLLLFSVRNGLSDVENYLKEHAKDNYSLVFLNNIKWK
ncbi:TPA: serine/threonine-protein phosphatase [Elizabethkingia anophelis]|nr:serine/threonine-protein phosphatase [Chryseobacterium gambrini]HAY3534794.1 serine/threonine-protein phosphatase [Elizabethkingia anophelis]HAY3546910.1 serine/threonine-protein phosphatase [Elizabethkingia anophelis]